MGDKMTAVATFRLSEDNEHIAYSDVSGLALAAIQGLHSMVQAKDAEIDALQKKNEAFESRLAALEGQLQISSAD